MIIYIITPEKNLLKMEAICIILPGIKGSFQLLEHHAPMIGLLKSGKLFIYQSKLIDYLFKIKNGFFEVKNGSINILIY